MIEVYLTMRSTPTSQILLLAKGFHHLEAFSFEAEWAGMQECDTETILNIGAVDIKGRNALPEGQLIPYFREQGIGHPVWLPYHGRPTPRLAILNFPCCPDTLQDRVLHYSSSFTKKVMQGKKQPGGTSIRIFVRVSLTIYDQIRN
jgi:hypothetical protein